MMAAPLVSPIESWAMPEKISNWAGNLVYSTDKIVYPKSVEELQKLIVQYPKMKVLGTKHCFNTIADSKDQFVSLRDMNRMVKLDTEKSEVTVEGGMKYGELAPIIDEKGFALHNLASLPHISVAGAVTTATHGSGLKNGNLSTQVVAIQFINASGEWIELKKSDGEKFNATVVGLGALGAIANITLKLQPKFQMRQWVFEKLPLSQLRDNFETIESAGYSVSLFTDWTTESINEVWIKERSSSPSAYGGKPEFFGAAAATKNVHPIIELSAENCTEQMGVDGPWYERLPHFKMGFTPSSGKELQAEYFVSKQNAVDAILAIQKIGKQISPHLFISEIRTIDGDDFWMSPCYKQPSVAIHFTLKQDWPNVSKLLPVIEKTLEPFNAKPHWGKLFTMSPAKLSTLYPKMKEFKNLVAEFDAKAKFRNAFLSRNLYGK